ncbi:variable surface protein [Plasmodium gonderi]|uniref:Variable surface protein n=1 Tax=Plasmodium gonderi TaxID=77519 RepID=A0A1Y1JT80_PLAGO|nr:variable surface protein [Plasmodium gonderi]GAW84347.1 variable surface protein [Plasmodium gonderi]
MNVLHFFKSIKRLEIEFPDLPSYKRYDDMNKEENLIDINGECDKLGLNDNDVITFCKRIVTFLTEASRIPWDKRKNYCYYFQHWFFDNIGKYYSAENKINKEQVVNKLFDMVSSLISKYSIDSSCRCAHSGTPLVWKEEKDLHDYHVNFNYITCNKENENKCEKYVEYVTYINSIYEEKEEFCCGEFELGFCDAYIKCDYDFNPNELLHKLKEELQVIKKAKNKVSNGTSTDSHDPIVNSFPQERTSQKFLEITSDNHEESLSRSSEAITVIPDISETTNKLIKSDNFPRLVVVSSIMGTIIFLFYYYKSITIRSQMHKRDIKKKKISKHNHGNFVNELLEHELESLLECPQARRSYISYHTGRVPFH